MYKMKKLILILLLCSCGKARLKTQEDAVVIPKEIKGKYLQRNGIFIQDAPDANLIQYIGKTIKSIEYCDGCAHGGDFLIIIFTDDVKLKIHAYKYDMQLYY